MTGDTARVLIAGIALALGVAVYVLDRGAGAIAFLPSGWTGIGRPEAVFGPAGRWLPSLAHGLAFGLLVGCWFRRTSSRLIACAAWTAIAAAFEIGQIPVVAHALAALLSGPLSALPFAEPLSACFRNGLFDPLDLIATLLAGALAAWMLSVPPQGARHESLREGL